MQERKYAPLSDGSIKRDYRVPILPNEIRKSDSYIVKSYRWRLMLDGAADIGHCSISQPFKWETQPEERAWTTVNNKANQPLRAVYSLSYDACGKPIEKKACDAKDACCGCMLCCLVRIPYAIISFPFTCCIGFPATIARECCCPAVADPNIAAAESKLTAATFPEFLQIVFAASEAVRDQIIAEKQYSILMHLYDFQIPIADNDRKQMFVYMRERGYNILYNLESHLEEIQPDMLDFLLTESQAKKIYRDKVQFGKWFDAAFLGMLQRFPDHSKIEKSKSFIEAQATVLAKHGIHTQFYEDVLIEFNNQKRDAVLQNMFRMFFLPDVLGEIVRDYVKDKPKLTFAALKK